MTRVLFSNPPWWDVSPDQTSILGGVRAGALQPFLAPVRSAPDRFVYGNYLPFPHQLASAASHLAQHAGVTVILRDSIALREDYGTFFKYAHGLRPDVIVLESAPACWSHDVKIVRQLHRNLPAARIVVCGRFESADHASLLAQAGVIALVAPDYEPGLDAVLNGARGVIHPVHLSETELNAAPLPLLEAATALHYCDPVPHAESTLSLPVYPHLHVALSRPPNSAGRQRYPLERIDALLTARLAGFPFRGVYFDDPGLALDDDHLCGLATLMLKFRTNWSALCQVETITADSALSLRKSGCHGVRLVVDPAFDLDAFARAAGYLKALGMTAHASFVRPVADKPAVKKALAGLVACNSIQDLVPDTLVVSKIETRTLVADDLENEPLSALQPCAS